MARLMALCSLPRSSTASTVPYTLLHSRYGRQQTPFRQPAPPAAGLALHADPKPRVDPGRVAFEFMRKLDINRGGMRGERTRLRLFSCALVYEDSAGFTASSVADRWWDPKRPDQPALWESKIVLLIAPVPLDMNTLKALKRCSLLDSTCGITVSHLYTQASATAPLAAAVPPVRCGSRPTNSSFLAPKCCGSWKIAGLAEDELRDGEGRVDGNQLFHPRGIFNSFSSSGRAQNRHLGPESAAPPRSLLGLSTTVFIRVISESFPRCHPRPIPSLKTLHLRTSSRTLRVVNKCIESKAQEPRSYARLGEQTTTCPGEMIPFPWPPIVREHLFPRWHRRNRTTGVRLPGSISRATALPQPHRSAPIPRSPTYRRRGTPGPSPGPCSRSRAARPPASKSQAATPDFPGGPCRDSSLLAAHREEDVADGRVGGRRVITAEHPADGTLRDHPCRSRHQLPSQGRDREYSRLHLGARQSAASAISRSPVIPPPVPSVS